MLTGEKVGLLFDPINWQLMPPNRSSSTISPRICCAIQIGYVYYRMGAVELHNNYNVNNYLVSIKPLFGQPRGHPAANFD